MNGQNQKKGQRNYMVMAPLVGAFLGVIFGLLLSLAVENFAFIGIGVALGTGVGAAIGADLDRK